jgi:signal peptidase II
MSRFGKMFWFTTMTPMLFGFDWCTKEAARALPLGDQVAVVPGLLAWTHAENPNIAFSLPVPHVFIYAFGVVAIAVLIGMVRALPSGARVQAVALASITAGAAGNLWDRIGDGTVTDFVQVYTDHPTWAPWLVERFGTATWPIFNVADSCVFVGVALWLIHGLTEAERPLEEVAS